eukprot:GEMP01021069.1.p1 GENE.GEMP01021069.1~~GEMP01021069.1.p1  ORF type:complete len:551 (-),score=108.89 GEMP01021069.1:919-2571(-)
MIILILCSTVLAAGTETQDTEPIAKKRRYSSTSSLSEENTPGDDEVSSDSDGDPDSGFFEANFDDATLAKGKHTEQYFVFDHVAPRDIDVLPGGDPAVAPEVASGGSFVDVALDEPVLAEGKQNVLNAVFDHHWHRSANDDGRSSGSGVIHDRDDVGSSSKPGTTRGSNNGGSSGESGTIRGSNNGGGSGEFETVNDGNDGDAVSADTTQSWSDSDFADFEYRKLKDAVLSGEFAPKLFAAKDASQFPASHTLVDGGLSIAFGLSGNNYNWQLAEQIGGGNYGVVYRATRSNRDARPRVPSSVAIKFAWNEETRVTLLAEASRLNRLKNAPGVPKLVGVARYGEEGVMMASQYFPRRDLETYLRNTPRGLRGKMLDMASNAFHTLHEIHNHHIPPIVHADIKPANLFLDNNDQIIFGDWGDGDIHSPLYASSRVLQGAMPSTEDDFVSLFLSIFQVDGTVTHGTGLMNDLEDRIPASGEHTAADWDRRLLSDIRLSYGFLDLRTQIWESCMESMRKPVTESVTMNLGAAIERIFAPSRCFELRPFLGKTA